MKFRRKKFAIDVQALYAALEKLPARQREAVVLFEISGFAG